MKLTSEQRAALPTDVFRAENQPIIKDHAAADQLRILLSKAIAQIVGISETPIIVSYAASRFDDCGDYPWLAVRCGNFFTDVQDIDFQNLRKIAINGGKNVEIIIGLLEDLAAGNWLSYFTRAFDIRYIDQTLSLMVENGVPWLIFGNTNAGDGGWVFSLFDDVFLKYYGEIPVRFDSIIEGDWSDFEFLYDIVWKYNKINPGQYEKNQNYNQEKVDREIPVRT